LLLDEFSSALDASTESTVLKNLREFCENKTSVFIAHRLSTIMDSDVIFVMDEGIVVEQGTHAELLEMNGRYAQMWNTQSQEV
jgi:ABC-type multidrug transport system fused ATPase/permease subunit